MRKIKFIIADNSYLINTGLTKTILSIKNIVVVRQIFDKKDIVNVINFENPDFVIINEKLLDNPHNDIISMFDENIKSRFILLVGEKHKNEHFEYFCDTICIDDSKTKIINKISKVINIQNYRNNERSNELSDREKDIIIEIAKGKTNQEIANSLFISVHTAITHRKNITKKLDIKTAAGLTVYAILNNLISIEEAG